VGANVGRQDGPHGQLKKWRPQIKTRIHLAALLAIPCLALAQAYPAKPPRLLVGFVPGGVVDITARIVAGKLSEFWGQAITVENRPGAGGTLAAAMAAKAPADGYTFIVCNIASNAIAGSLYKNLPYDPIKDFTPISLIGTTPNVMVIHPSVPAANVAQFIAYAKANPGKMSYGSSGVGTSTHLSVELFKSMAGVNLVHVPYKGGAQSGADLLGGQIQLLITPLPEQLGNIRAGRVRALGVTTSKRTAQLPDVPTIAEAGLPGYEVTVWLGICAPARMPQDLVQKVNADVVKALSSPDTKQRLAEQGIEVGPNTPKQFTAFMQAELAKWAKVVKESGASAD
jgi:tripartite-type tricarboxylate transporter receptor subunit TctC